MDLENFTGVWFCGSTKRTGGATRGVWLTNMQVAAFRSLAASRGIEFADVVDAAVDGRLRGVVEMRDRDKQRRIHDQTLAHIPNPQPLARARNLAGLA